MAFYERVGNLHIHTTYSDGASSHAEVARAASRAGLDYLIVTDHNIYAVQHEGWYDNVLLLVGEEVHSPANVDANHYLIFNARQQMAPFGDDPQRLVDAARARGGLGFIAHPHEHSGAFAGEPEIDWLDWQVKGYDGLEIWNYMSEFKSYLTNLGKTLLYAFFPKVAIAGPFPETLAKWDELLSHGRVPAIGGSDAHANVYRLGILQRRIFGYQHLFTAVNTHLLIADRWSGDPALDGRLVYDALARGRAFVGYDGLASTRGFRFVAECRGKVYEMGDEVVAEGDVCLCVRSPARAYLRLIHDGSCIAETLGTELTHLSHAPGAYRGEAHRTYLFKRRGWVYSNPIYVRA